MWDGAFLPSMKKHRDYQHNTVAEHLMANGIWERGDQVTVDTNPVTEEPYESPQRAQKVDITYHGKTYTYLIRTAAAVATVEEIKSQINEYMNNRIEGGRDWESYLSDDSRLEEFLNGLSI